MDNASDKVSGGAKTSDPHATESACTSFCVRVITAICAGQNIAEGLRSEFTGRQ